MTTHELLRHLAEAGLTVFFFESDGRTLQRVPKRKVKRKLAADQGDDHDHDRDNFPHDKTPKKETK
jgi:hypothetical protein